jgi:hypothetical protein
VNNALEDGQAIYVYTAITAGLSDNVGAAILRSTIVTGVLDGG